MNTAILRLFKPSYYVVFYFFLFASFFAHTQEIVIDVEPDEVIVASSTPFSIDFTNDAVDDFTFRVQTMVGDTVLGGQPSTYDGSSAIVECPAGQPMGITENGSFSLTNLGGGASVSSADEFGLDTSYPLGINLLIDAGIGIFPYIYGDFLGVSNQYLGVRFTDGGNTHYGWIELSVSAEADTIIVHRYAYSATPEVSIDTGDGDASLFFTEDLSIRVWSSSDLIHVELESDYLGSQFSLVSLSGKELINTELVELSSEIDVSYLPQGMYLLHVCNGSQITTERIYIR
jgi:hypothetical protein